MPAKVHYDPVRCRWVIAGKDEKPKEYIPDNQTLISQKLALIATLAAAVGVGTLAMGVGSVAFAGVAAGDHVVVNPKAAMTLGLAGARVSGAGNINVFLQNQNLAVATQAPVGLDLLAIRHE